jgi:ankyrin repeat protein
VSARSDLSDDEVEFLLEALNLARIGDTAQLVALIDAGLPVNLTNAAGDSLLILAAYHRHHATVAMLLNHGADHARINDRGQSALAAAVFRRSSVDVQALLSVGADPLLGDPSAVQVAEFFQLDDMLIILKPFGVSSGHP